MAVFSYLDDLLSALEALKSRNLKFTVFSPLARHEIKEIVGAKPSVIRYVTLFGALAGMALGLSLALYTTLQWKFIVSGKPIVPWVPFVVVAFEFTILLGVIVPFIGLMIIGRIPRSKLPAYYDPRFSNDRFGILVPVSEVERQQVVRLLNEVGAEEIHEVEG